MRRNAPNAGGRSFTTLTIRKDMTRYHYATVNAQTFLGACKVPAPPDSYLAMDEETRALIDILKLGYRFIAIHDDLALFEKDVSQGSLSEKLSPGKLSLFIASQEIPFLPQNKKHQ